MHSYPSGKSYSYCLLPKHLISTTIMVDGLDIAIALLPYIPSGKYKVGACFSNSAECPTK